MVIASVGSMSPERAERFKEALQGETHMSFNVICGVQPGPSRYVSVATEHETTKEKLLEFALYTISKSL